jgi:parvulin-like peptidyl-prolyl isomerase
MREMNKPAHLAAAVALAASLLAIPAVASGQTARPGAAPNAAPARNTAVQSVALPAARSPAENHDAGSPAADNGDVIARVGADNITANEIRAYVAALDGNQQAAFARDPALLSQAVRLMLANRLVLQEALAKKWEQQPDVAAQLQKVRDNAIAELYLQAVTSPPSDYPSEADIQKVYDANTKAFIVPRQFELAQIFIAVPQNADPAAEAAAKTKLTTIETKLAAPGTDFTAVARTDNDAQNGGQLGWLSEPQIRPEILSQVMGLPSNAASKPIRLEDGWHIIKLLDTKASFTRTLPEVRGQLVQQMRAERATAARRAYLGQLLQQHPPVLNEFALSSLLAKSAQ